MTTCPLCLSSIPDQAAACTFCGATSRTKVKKLTAKAAKEGLEEVANALSEESDLVDRDLALKLLKEGSEALEEGDVAVASRAHQALVSVLKLAKKSKTSKQHGAAGSLSQVRRLLKASRRKVNYAKERGGNITRAQQLLQSAEKAIDDGDSQQGRKFALDAARAADYARKNARAEQLIVGVEKRLKTAAQRGAEVEKGREILANARKAMKSGVYADVQKWTRVARDFAEKARRTKIGEDAIHRVEKLLEEEAAEGSDLSRATPHLEEAWKALKDGKFSAVTKALQRCRKVIEEASRLRKARESLEILREELQELHAMKAETEAAEDLFSKAEKALEGADWSAFRRQFQVANRTAKNSRKEREKEFVFNTVERLVEKAGKGGVSALGARELLDEVEKALGQGRHADIDSLVEAKFEAEATKRENEILRGVGELRGALAEFRVAGIEVSGAAGLLERAEEALEAKKLGQAQELLGKAQKASESLKEALQASATRSIQELEDELGELGKVKLVVPEAEEFLRRSKEAMEKGDVFQAADLARLATKACQEARERQRLEARSAKDRTEIEELSLQLERVKGMLEDLDHAGVDISESQSRLQEALEALKKDDATKAKPILEELEEAATAVSGSLVSAARDLIAAARLRLARATKHWEAVPEAEELLKNAEAMFDDARYDEAIELAKMSERKARSRMERLVDQAKGEVRSKVANFQGRIYALKRLMRDMTRAEISIEGSEEDLILAEEAIQEGDFEAAEEHLSAVEDIAEILSAGLEGAAQDMLKRAEKEIRQAKDEGGEIPRGEAVLETAQEALKRGRFVEVLEYCKVIDDIITSVRQKSTLGDIAAFLESVRSDLQQLEARGIKMSKTEGLLEEIQEAMAKGDVEKAKIMVDSLGDPLADLRTPEVSQVREETRDIASKVGEARELLSQAQSRVETGETKDLRELLAKAQVSLGGGVEAAKALVDEVKEQFQHAENLGVEIAPIKDVIKKAEASLEENPERALQSLMEARNTILDSVRRVDRESRPEVVVELPEVEFVEGRWMPATLRIRNTGKVPARRVRVNLRGDLEVKGMETLPQLPPGEETEIEVSIRPRSQGELPVRLDVTHRGFFEDEDVLSSSEETLTAVSASSYIVEDVFLVHSDGRLICHQSAKTLDEIDEDIFSGMLTVVQDFVKDSFRKRTRVGLKRLEFEESKIIIERGSYIYLAAVLIGDEPELLPLYMTEIINEIERTHGKKLEKWTGVMSDVEGIEDSVRKLVFFTEDDVIRGPEGTETTIGSAMTLIRGGKALGLDLGESEQLLLEAKETVSKDLEKAWALTQSAVEKALESQQDIQKKLKGVLDALDTSLEELSELGLEDLADLGTKYQESRNEVERAKRALARGEYDVAARMVSALEVSVSSLRERVVSERIEKELDRLDKTLRELRADGAELGEAQETLDRAMAALGSGKLGEVNAHLEAADELTRKMQDEFLTEKYEGELRSLQAFLDTLSKEDKAPKGADKILTQAFEALEKHDIQELGFILDQARKSLLGDGDESKARQPRLVAKTPTISLQANTWNLLPLDVVNKGEWPAEDVEVRLLGDLESKGERNIDRLEPGKSQRLNTGLMPKREGETVVEIEIAFKSFLEKERNVVRDIREPEVVPKDTYPVGDVILYLPSGEAILHEGRKFREEAAETAFYERVQPLQRYVLDSEKAKSKENLRRMDLDGGGSLVVRGKNVYLGAVYDGKEPQLLSLYMLQMLRELKDEHGDQLKDWKSDPEVVEGVRKIIRKLLLVTDKTGVDLGPLIASPITSRLLYGTPADQRGTQVASILEEVRKAADQGGLEKGLEVMFSLLGRPFDEAAVKEPPGDKGLTLEVDDATLRENIEIVKEIDKAVSKARGKAGLEAHWPVEKIAIRAANPKVATAASSFKAIIMNHANAREVDILQRGEFWKGAELRMQINQDALAKSYRGWARKIELILKSQDPWKIKGGIDRGGYEMGIEGQVIRIFPNMVTFQLVMPPQVVVQQFPGGIVFLDTALTEETKAEGYANEIIRIVLEARKELGVEDPKPVTLRVAASEDLTSLLVSMQDHIAEEAHVSDVEFVGDVGEDGYVLDCDVRGEKFTLAVKKG